ncbi:MAG TPA: 30S ribosomal protein S8 [Candidatus Saccharimonadales bacterium]|nr:30S ribosomal protein S8 [Candidatus Saccharimonadales bacterium]
MTMTTDPIADMLTRIRNGLAVRKASVLVPHSKMKEAIAGILKDNGFVTGFKVETASDGFKTMTVALDDGSHQPSLSNLQRISKPGRRVYYSSADIPLILGGRGMVIISTSKGVMSGREARKAGLGGELICKVW